MNSCGAARGTRRLTCPCRPQSTSWSRSDWNVFGGTRTRCVYARQQLVELTGQTPIVPDSPDWYGCMAHVPLPPGDARTLQQQLWTEFGIEVPIISWGDRRWIRVSCHLYNTRHEIDRLVDALRRLVYVAEG